MDPIKHVIGWAREKKERSKKTAQYLPLLKYKWAFYCFSYFQIFFNEKDWKNISKWLFKQYQLNINHI